MECNRLFYGIPWSRRGEPLATGVRFGFSKLWMVLAALARAREAHDQRTTFGPLLSEHAVSEVIFAVSRHLHAHVADALGAG